MNGREFICEAELTFNKQKLLLPQMKHKFRAGTIYKAYTHIFSPHNVLLFILNKRARQFIFNSMNCNSFGSFAHVTWFIHTLFVHALALLHSDDDKATALFRCLFIVLYLYLAFSFLQLLIKIKSK